ncbi:SDR family NAD(P)-dependent oxidoreductase [Natronorubrum halophilum]|uniref:SDR family NAD(P)-dependent oxidoreductase n=1 Tax=Natronorubrum halophilum TaxID=1702106 RepID=UPI0010C21C82|nr:glucose 1-dehydrogenase [Natronorubrum halophilum]
MSDLLTGKTAVVTGGASGIGRGIALKLASHGADIVVADLRETPRTRETTPTLEAIEAETGSQGRFVECDVTNYEDVVDAVDAADEFGGIDVMVNNAGIVHPVEFFETDDDDFEALVSVNLKGAYFGCQAAGERMLENGGGSIINVASTAAEQGFVEPGSILYCAAKGGVKSMTFAIADLLGPEVRVNAIQPGFTDETGLAENHDAEAARARAAETSLDRLGKPDDLGNVAVFLASDLSSYVTAEGILVDGGWVNTGGP